MNYRKHEQEELIRLAGEGDAEAMYELADRYGNDSNESKQFEYLKKAAEHGSIAAQWELAATYEKHGNSKEALLWYEKAYDSDMTFDYTYFNLIERIGYDSLNYDSYCEIIQHLKEEIKKEEEEKEKLRRQKEQERINQKKALRDPTFDLLGIVATVALFFLVNLYVMSGAGAVNGSFGLLKTIIAVGGIFITTIASGFLLLTSISFGVGWVGGVAGFIGSILILTLSDNYPSVPTYARIYCIVAIVILIFSIIRKQIKYR